MVRRSLVPLLVIGCFALTWGGCGESETEAITENDKASPPPLAQSKFVKQAEAICARGRLRGLRFDLSLGGESEREAFTRGLEDALLPALQEVIDELSALNAPPGEESQIDELLGDLQKAVNQANALKKPTMVAINDLLDKPGRLARQLGLESCVYGEVT